MSDERTVDNHGPKLWHIRYTLPPSKTSPYTTNKSLTVAACNMETAIHMVKEHEPDAVLWQVNHRGKLDLL